MTESIHEDDDGTLMVVGRYATDEEIAKAGAKVDDGEAAVVFERTLLTDIGMVDEG